MQNVAFRRPGKEQTFRIPLKFMMRVVGDYFSIHDINLQECRKIRHKLLAELIEGGVAEGKPYAFMHRHSKTYQNKRRYRMHAEESRNVRVRTTCEGLCIPGVLQHFHSLFVLFWCFVR